MADGALRLWVARGGRELLGLWVAAGSRPGTPGWRTERCGCGLLLGPGRVRRDGGRSAAVVGCQGWPRAPGVVGCCWVPAGYAGMADGALRLWVARGGRELLGLWVAAGSRPRTPGWRTEPCGCGLPGVAASCWGCGLLLGPGRVRRDGGRGRSAAVVGCQGWPRAPGVVGCCWVPAGDAGMAEGDGALRELGARGGLGGLGSITALGPGRGRRDGGGERSAAGVGSTGWPGWAGIDHGAGSRPRTPGWRRDKSGARVKPPPRSRRGWPGGA